MGVQFAGNILVQANGGPLPIAQGGTGQTTAPTAINALLPTQAGQSGKVLTTDGTNVSWATGGGGTPGGSDTQIQFNNSGTFGGLASLVINKTTGALTGTSTFTNAGENITGAAGTIRPLKFQTAGSDRWLMQANATAESGSAAGSNFEFTRVADNGSTANQVFTVARSTGVVDFKVAPTVNGAAIGGSSTSLDGTTAPTATSAVSGIYAGTFGTDYPGLRLINSSQTTDQKATGIYVDPTNGTFHMSMINDALLGQNAFLSVSRSGAAASVITFTVPGVNFSGLGTTGFRINNSAGTAGQVLTSQGSAAAPTWSSPSVTALNGTSAPGSRSGTSSGVYAGNISSSPNITFTNGAASAANRAMSMSVDNSGIFHAALLDDALTTATDWLAVARSGSTTTTTITYTSGGVNFAGLGTTGFRVNNSAGTTGQVLTSQGASAAPIWATPTATATTLSATGGITPSGTTTGVFAGVSGAAPVFGITNASAAADNRFSTLNVNSSGLITFQLVNDAWNLGTAYLTVARSANTATLITTASTGVNLTGLTTGLQLNGAAGSAGQVLTSQGSAAAPTWTSPAVTALNGTGAPTATSATTGVFAGALTTNYPGMRFINPSRPADEKATAVYVDPSGGSFNMSMVTDNLLSQNAFLTVTRTGASAQNLTFTTTGVNFAGLGTTGFRINNSAGTTGQVLTSQGAAAAPTWTTLPSAAVTATYVGYGNGSNVLTGTSNFTFNNSTNTLQIGTLITTPTVIAAMDVAAGSTAAPSMTLRGGHGQSSNVNAGGLFLRGGDYQSTNIGTGGNVTLAAGSATGGGTGAGGNVLIQGGTTTSGTTGGYISFSTTAAAGAVGEKFRITPAGAFSLGATGTATGTANAPMLSGGSAATPLWATSFLWDNTTRVMNLGISAANGATIAGPDLSSTTAASGITLRGGDVTASTGGGGAVVVRGGNSTGGASGALTLQGGTGGTVGGAITITAGSGTTTNGAITITSGGATTSNAGGAMTLTAGSSDNGAGAGGAMTINAGGTGSSSSGNGGAVNINSGGASGGAGNGGAINITSGSSNAGTGGAINISGGTSGGTLGPNVTITAGAGGVTGGNLVLRAGPATSTGGTTGGDIVLSTYPAAPGSLAERFRITTAGAWALNGAANVGTSGQYLRTTGSSVIWSTVGAAPSNLTSATSGTYIGTNGTAAESVMVTTSATADNRVWMTRANSTGTYTIQAFNDALDTATTALQIGRTGTTINTIAFTGTAMTTSGTFQSTTVNVTGSTAPANGVYLPAANSVGISTNTTESIRIDSNGNLLIQRVGAGLRIKEGSNARMGVATLVGGTVTVSTTAVSANSRIFLTTQSVTGTAGFLVVSARTAATSFTILSSSGTDASTVAWMIVEPA